VNGVSIYREMTAGMSAGRLATPLGEAAKPTPDLASYVHFDVCPTWLELAIRHLSDAQVAQGARAEAWKGADENAKAGALQWEFEASMQAIVAAAIAIDALSAAVRPRVNLPQLLVEKWREKHTPPYIQTSEVLRRALSLRPRAASALRQNLGEISRFRNLAIDPSGTTDAPVLHPELHVGVEWRFAYFRCDNALLIVKITLRLILELLALGEPQDAEVRAYMHALRSRVEPLQNLNAFGPQARRDHRLSVL
jgi:hypothetical protein